MLLECYERFGPIFTLRLFHGERRVHARAGGQPLHHRLPRLQLPVARLALPRPDRPDGRRAAHDRRRVPPPLAPDHAARPSTASTSPRRSRRSSQETDACARPVHARRQIDLYAWTRRLALRVAMRALFGLDPDSERARAIDAAGLFEQALSFYSSRLPAADPARLRYTPWARMQQAARKLDTLIYSEIARRRADGERGQRHPQPAARRPRRGRQHAQRPADPRRGDDAPVRRPRHHHLDRLVHVLRARPQPRTSSPACSPSRTPSSRTARRPPPSSRPASSPSSRCVLDETLRKYPPAWVGPRRSVEPFEFEGHTVPAPRVRQLLLVGVATTSPTCSPNRRRSVPSDSRRRPARRCPRAPTCPSAAARARASACASASSRCARSQRSSSPAFTLSLPEDFKLAIRQMPTISPKQGLPDGRRPSDRCREPGARSERPARPALLAGLALSVSR